MKIIYTRPDGGTSVITLADKSSIPQASGMTDAEFFEWVKAKDVPADATNVQVVQDSEVPIEPTQVPSKVLMRQARLALFQSGYLSQVDALIASMPGAEGDSARIEWEFASNVLRSHPLVAAMAASLPLTGQQLDDLFTLANSL